MTTKTTTEKIANPFESTIAVLMTQRRLGLQRKIRDEARAVDSDEREVDRDNITLSKQLFKSDRYKLIVKEDTEMRSWLHEVSVPSILREGVVLVPIELFTKVTEEIEDYLPSRAKLVDDFIANYYDEIEAAKKRLGALFKRGQYPDKDTAAAAFSVEIQYVDFKVSEGLRGVDVGLWKKEQERLESSMRLAAQQIQMAMRASFLQLVDHLSERLTPGPDGKPKVFRDTAVTNLTEWLDMFSARNVTNDTTLQALVDKCKQIVAGAEPEDLRSDVEMRVAVSKRLDEVKQKLESVVTAKPKRKFAFEPKDPTKDGAAA